MAAASLRVSCNSNAQRLRGALDNSLLQASFLAQRSTEARAAPGRGFPRKAEHLCREGAQAIRARAFRHRGPESSVESRLRRNSCICPRASGWERKSRTLAAKSTRASSTEIFSSLTKL